MARLQMRNRRRGATTAIALITLSALLIATGVEIDYGRTVVSRQKDQVIADATAMAAVTYLPRYSSAVNAGNRVVTTYRSSYNSSFTCNYTLTPNALVPT